MGGIDNANTTSIALRGIDMLKLNSVAVDVVVGASCPHRHEIDALSRSIRQCRLFGSVDTLAPLMSAADLAIGASGTATWERCCVGLPTLTMSIADNQEPIAEGSQLAGFAINLGRCERVTPELIARGIKHLLGNPLLVQQMSQAGMRLVDGMGAERVIETILTGVHAETKSA
jgi:UDP-2,4-diacetamido-2,4,6-trideoxy-beta-L-altropyranose hydrolase